MAFLVYPGTLHTRFDHSIGVMHIAGRICNQLKQLRKITAVECDRGSTCSVASRYRARTIQPRLRTSFRHVRTKGLGIQSVEKIHEKVTVDIIE